MAGHSKFKNIQYRKSAQDKKRAKIFSRLAREITVAAKMGGEDSNANPRLRTALITARAQNMPRDNIDRAIRKSTDKDTTSYDEVRYEGFVAGGVGVIVDTLTDNRNRTSSDIRTIFSRHGGRLAETGAVSFMFSRLGFIAYDTTVAKEDDMLEAALEAGANDCFIGTDGKFHILCDGTKLHQVHQKLEAIFKEPYAVHLTMRAQDLVPLSQENHEKLMLITEAIENHEDVQNVYTNHEAHDDETPQL